MRTRLLLAMLTLLTAAALPVAGDDPEQSPDGECQVLVWTGARPQIDTEPVLGIVYVDERCILDNCPVTLRQPLLPPDIRNQMPC